MPFEGEKNIFESFFNKSEDTFLNDYADVEKYVDLENYYMKSNNPIEVNCGKDVQPQLFTHTFDREEENKKRKLFIENETKHTKFRYNSLHLY